MNNKDISETWVERFVLMLAFFNEKYPDPNPSVNKTWKMIRDKHEGDCLKYDKCEICGTEDLLCEYGLNHVCFDPECQKKVKDFYDKEIIRFRNLLIKQSGSNEV